MPRHASLIVSCSLVCALAACGDDPGAQKAASAGPAAGPEGTPRAEAPPAQPAQQLLFGDLHIHTSLSSDAFSAGVRSLPDDAYRYAKGEETQHPSGYPMRLGRALDFAAVTDHSEYLGSMREFLNPESPLAAHPLAKLFASEDPADAMKAIMRISDDASQGGGLSELLVLPEVSARAWRTVIEAAERHNEPGRFSTLIGYEWTSGPDEINLHRNVIFRGSAVPERPFSRLDSENPEELWKFLDAERAAGREGMAIPHNSNASDGRMWQNVDWQGAPVDTAWAARRIANEPVVEMVQIKGTSETHPLLSSDDEFAGFELWTTRMSGAVVPRPSQPQGSYVRDALKSGLAMAAALGVNPHQFGLIGSSDSHNANSPIEENNYTGKLARLDGTPELRHARLARAEQARAAGLENSYSAAGLAAVWAEANTREAIYDALRRRETYATSGPRISLRFFGGWSLPQDLLEHADFAARAYAAGVPMGASLAPRKDGAPRFAVLATRDPGGANLDRVQIVKGWLAADGSTHEKVFDVAWAGEREPDAQTGKLPPIGSSVDIATATWDNSIGTPELGVLWTDPEFDPAQYAFWYVRVLEIPTPRWSTHDAASLGVEPTAPAEIQERAWSSPIWYSPAG